MKRKFGDNETKQNLLKAKTREYDKVFSALLKVFSKVFTVTTVGDKEMILFNVAAESVGGRKLFSSSGGA